MLRVLNDPVAAERMGRRAARSALRFTWDATADEVLGAYRELIPG